MRCVSSLCSLILFILYSYQQESLQIMMPLYMTTIFVLRLLLMNVFLNRNHPLLLLFIGLLWSFYDFNQLFKLVSLSQLILTVLPIFYSQTSGSLMYVPF